MTLDIVAGLFVFIGVIFVLIASWVLFRKNWFVAWLRGSAGIVLLLVAVYLSLMAANLYHYDDLTADKPLATLSFTQKADQSFVVTVSDGDDQRRQYDLKGDLWQLDARILRWKPFVSVLGIKPSYQLDRISGRYFSLQDERSKARTVYELAESSFGVDLWLGAQSGFNIFANSDYGSATYLPMADGAIYEVRLSDSGLTAVGLNAAAEDALQAWQ